MSKDAAEIVKAQVAEIKAAAEILVAAIKADTKVAMGKLAEAKPALDEAEAALNVCFSFILIYHKSICIFVSCVFNRPSNLLILQPYESWENLHT